MDQELIEAIRCGKPLKRSAELRRLAEKVLEAMEGTPDIDAWARRLAEDVADLTD